MTDIFNDTPTTPTLDQFVGEGKKYADSNAVAKALVEKDNFIQRLQEENRAREARILEMTNLQAYNDRIAALEAAQVERREPTPPPTATPAPVAPQAAVDEEAVYRMMEQREQSQKRSRNLMEVKDKLTAVFGQDYPTRVKAKAQELGLDMAHVNALAADAPSAFYALIGLNAPGQAPVNSAPPATQVNSAAQFAPNVGKKNNEYYSKMRRENPAAYFTPKIALEEMNEAKRQGPAFYDP